MRTPLRGFGVNVLRHHRLVVLPQFRNADLECIRDESATLRYEQTTDACRANLANSATSFSPLGCPLVVASVVLVSIEVGLRVKKLSKHAFECS